MHHWFSLGFAGEFRLVQLLTLNIEKSLTKQLNCIQEDLSFFKLALPRIGCAIGLWTLSGRVSHNDARDIGKYVVLYHL